MDLAVGLSRDRGGHQMLVERDFTGIKIQSTVLIVAAVSNVVFNLIAIW